MGLRKGLMKDDLTVKNYPSVDQAAAITLRNISTLGNSRSILHHLNRSMTFQAENEANKLFKNKDTRSHLEFFCGVIAASCPLPFELLS